MSVRTKVLAFDAYEAAGHCCGEVVDGFGEVGDADAGEKTGDAVVYFAQRFFDGAMAGEVAGSVNGDAAGDEERAVDGADNFEGGDAGRGTGESVAAVGAGVGDEQAGAGEGLEDLGEELRRNVVGLGDVLRGAGACEVEVGTGLLGEVSLLGEIFEGHEAVVRFFGEPEHGVDGGKRGAKTWIGMKKRGLPTYLVYGNAGWEARPKRSYIERQSAANWAGQIRAGKSATMAYPRTLKSHGFRAFVTAFRQFRAAPNLLTMLRLFVLPFLVITILAGHWRLAFALLWVAGVSDGLDGLLARWLEQRTKLGEYLDPIADKLLLSTMFLVLTHVGAIPRFVTVLVLSRDIGILLIATLLFATNTLRNFQPSKLGKLNTLVQILGVLTVMTCEVIPRSGLGELRTVLLWAIAALAPISAAEYAWIVIRRVSEPVEVATGR